MSDMLDITELDFNDDTFSGNFETKTASFGGGLELLMNNKVKEYLILNKFLHQLKMKNKDNLLQILKILCSLN